MLNQYILKVLISYSKYPWKIYILIFTRFFNFDSIVKHIIDMEQITDFTEVAPFFKTKQFCFIFKMDVNLKI